MQVIFSIDIGRSIIIPKQLRRKIGGDPICIKMDVSCVPLVGDNIQFCEPNKDMIFLDIVGNILDETLKTEVWELIRNHVFVVDT